MSAWLCCPAARGQSGHVCTTATAECYPMSGCAGNIANAGCSRDLPAEHEALTCACARLEVTSELHVDKVATQALLQLLNDIERAA